MVSGHLISGYINIYFDDSDMRHVCFQVLRSVSQAWANPSAVKHTPLEQQLYVSKALLLSVNLLEESELQELRSGKKETLGPPAQHKNWKTFHC